MLPIRMKWRPDKSRWEKILGVLPSLICVLVVLPATSATGGSPDFHKDIQPILIQYCYDCHGDGMEKGKVAFDAFRSDAELLAKHDLWWAVLKNLRAGIMPPEKKPRPSVREVALLEKWVKAKVFGSDPADPDPGRVTIRRLNRVEYRNTIRDLMGVDFKADDEFPPDDTGYGFDNIGDVLTVSPLLLEKYMQAAETIVANAVPTVRKVVAEKSIAGAEFKTETGKGTGERISFFKPAHVSHAVRIEQAGDYRLVLDLDVAGAFDFDPARCSLLVKLGDREVSTKEFGWHSNKRFHFEFPQKLEAGTHHLSFVLEPIAPMSEKKGVEESSEPRRDTAKSEIGAKTDTNAIRQADGKRNSGEKRDPLDLKIATVRLQGPLDAKHWVAPKNFARFFPKDEPPSSMRAKREYAHAVLTAFTGKAFRRPVDDRTVKRLVTIAEGVYTQPGKRFEHGIGQAIVAVLSSPRFIFRVEETERGRSTSRFALVDEHALASRLSYFLWSTMPDDDLRALADKHELRSNLSAQVSRMLADKRSEAFIQNFTGQWLQVRDVEGIAINERIVLARDNGEERALRREAEEFRARFASRQSQTNRQGRGDRQFRRPRLFEKPKVELDRDLRRAMQQETEMSFAYVMRDNRTVLELLDSDYTFLNEKLANHYGIPDVKGNDMRRVTLPKDSPRGGLLTQGSVLLVTSNPTRTSPVKRGLFILDNITGAPTPPPPPDVPLLEESEKAFTNREPTLREVLDLHRGKALCSSCHSRMDPLGLALENFNAMGMWREKERGQSIDVVGKLITGESFHDVRELKQILKNNRRLDFYRCLTEKLLTYALGRGLDYYDVETVDQIVASLDANDGRFSALLMGVIDSAPFQKKRTTSEVTAARPNQSSKKEAVQAKLQP